MGGPVAPKLIQLTQFSHVLSFYLHFGPVRRPHVAIHVPLAGICVLKTSIVFCLYALCQPLLLKSWVYAGPRRATLIDSSSDCNTNICLERYSYALGGGWV